MKKFYLTLVWVTILIVIPVPKVFSQGFEIEYARYMEEEALRGKFIDTSGIDSLNCDSFANRIIKSTVKLGFISSVTTKPLAIISVKSSEWNILIKKDSIYFEFLSDTTNIELNEGNLFKRNGHWWCYCSHLEKDWYRHQIGFLKQQLE